MTESLAQSKKHLALDTDWHSAAAMVALFVICASVGARELFEIVHATKPVITITWHSWLLLGMCVLWFGWGGERWFRTISLVVALGVASRIVLRVGNASVETQLADAALTRVIDLMVCGGGCAGISWWFSSKIRYV